MFLSVLTPTKLPMQLPGKIHIVVWEGQDGVGSRFSYTHCTCLDPRCSYTHCTCVLDRLYSSLHPVHSRIPSCVTGGAGKT